MSASLLLWIAAGTAGLLALVRQALLSSAWIQPKLLNAVLLRLVAARNWERARKLCRTAPKSPYCAALAHVFEAVEVHEGQPHSLDLLTELTLVWNDRNSEYEKRLNEPKWLGVLGWLAILAPLVAYRQVVWTMRHSNLCIGLFALAALLQLFAELRIVHMRRANLAGAAQFLPQLAKQAQIDPPKSS